MVRWHDQVRQLRLGDASPCDRLVFADDACRPRQAVRVARRATDRPAGRVTSRAKACNAANASSLPSKTTRVSRGPSTKSVGFSCPAHAAIALQDLAQARHAATQSSMPPSRSQSLAHSVQISAHSRQQTPAPDRRLNVVAPALVHAVGAVPAVAAGVVGNAGASSAAAPERN